MVALLVWAAATFSAHAADYTTFLTAERGFVEVTSTSGITGNANDYYILVSAENTGLIVGIGRYEAKPDWASEDSKALRYKSAATDPVLDLSNFFTIEKSGNYIGLRNVVYSADLFQTHDNAGYMYVNTFSDKNLDEWSYLTPTFQNGYWLFESGKYPISSDNWACGYLGPWNKLVADGEPMALNRRNTEGDAAGHYRLFRIAKADLMTAWSLLWQSASASNMLDVTSLITNPSFETGTTLGWTQVAYNGDGEAIDVSNNDEFKVRGDYSMTNKAGNYLMNAFLWWAPSVYVTQNVTHVPSGEYELSGVLCTWEGRTVTLSGNEKQVTLNGQGDQTGVRVSTPVTVGNNGMLTIKCESTAQWWVEGHDSENQTFFKLDDVQLKCKGIYLNAMAQPLPNDNTTTLLPDFWYYYDVDYPTEYMLAGNITDMLYCSDGNKYIADITTAAATREMTLPKGRVYFKTTHSDATLSLHPARNVEELGTFTAVALNVDGLPKEIDIIVKKIELNPDGPGEDGTKKISRYLASKNYDIIGCSEDFNYNGSLMESLNDNYSCGTIRKTLSVSGVFGGFPFDTDGLNLLWKKATCSATNESWTRWESTESTDGNQYVKKGYRHYDMTLGNDGPVIDVFILHMDAGDTNATDSRHSQWEQLAGAVNALAGNSRPKLIIGDTNSRWTREDITAHFMNRLSTDLTASDVWVEFYRNGIYPTTDMADLTDQSVPTNYSNYEIVDKIIYINPKAANTVQLVPQSFRIEQDYTYGKVKELEGGVNDDNTPLGDHRPVVVTFKYMKSGDVQNIPVTLTNDADNTKTINDYSGLVADVTLSGRTLYKDEAWNTLCLPFNIDATATATLLGTEGTLMELDTEATVDGHKTGLEGTTLYLNFKDATSITAGTPYIIKWDNSSDLVNPLFTGVTISTATPAEVGSTDSSVAFVGTYGPVALSKDDKTNLFMDADNTLNWPSVTDYHVNAFRAYFRLSSANSAREFVLNFGDAEATGIDGATLNNKEERINGASLNNKEERIKNQYYDLSGRRLEGRPTKPGVYMRNGQKVVMR